MASNENIGNKDDINSGTRSRADSLSAPPSARDTSSQQGGAGTARQGGFPSASPESNVNPAGAPQSSHGSATGPIPGGTTGAARGQGSLQSGMGAAAAGGNPGTSASSEGINRQGSIKGLAEGGEVEKLAAKDEGGVGGADSR